MAMTNLGWVIWDGRGRVFTSRTMLWETAPSTDIQFVSQIFAETYQISVQDGYDEHGTPINQRVLTEHYCQQFSGQSYYWRDPVSGVISAGPADLSPQGAPAGTVKTGRSMSDEAWLSLYNQAKEVRALPEMALSIFQGSITSPAGTGSQAYTGVGFAPKAIIFFGTGTLTADGYGASHTPFYAFVGSTTSANQVAGTWQATDAGSGGATDTATRWDHGAVLACNNAGAVTMLAVLTAFGADGFTLNWTTTPGAGRIVYYLALGGADLTDVMSGDFNVPATTTGNLDITSLAFQPDVVLFLDANGATTTALGAVDSIGGMGAALSSSARWTAAWSGADADSMASFDQDRTQRTDSCLIRITKSGLEFRADFVSFLSNGFRINRITVPGAQHQIGFLALKGGQYAVGAAAKPTGAATANQDVTGLAFNPVGVLLGSWGIAASTSITTEQVHSLGASEYTHEGTVWRETQDSALEANQAVVSTKALRLATGPSTTNAECDASSLSGGFRLAWTTNNAVASEITYVAFGSAAVVAGAARKRTTTGVGT